MKELVKFELPEGRSVLVEVDEEEPGYDRAVRGKRGKDELAVEAASTFDSALEVVRPTANAIYEKFQGLTKPPDEVEVQFGIRLNFKAGAVIASTEGEGHFQVRLTWMKPS